MRIAYVCFDSGVPVFGRKGCSIHCQQVIRTFRRRGFDIDLLATRLDQDIPSDLSDVNLFPLNATLPKDRAERELALVRQNSLLIELLKSHWPYDLIYERYSLWSHAAMEFARESSIPGVLEVNSPLIEEQKAYRSLVHHELADQISDRCLAAASSVICVSQGVATAACKPEHQTKVTVIPNGVDVGTIRPRFSGQNVNGKNGHADGSMNIGFVGTLKPWHGVNYLIDSFQSVRVNHPNTRLTIVGDGPEKENLLRQLQNYSESMQRSVTWTGAIPNWQMPQVLESFDIAVAPYPAIDNFYFSPLKILEYMAAGLPVVASRIGQIPELIDHGRTGLLVEPGNISELSATVEQLCDNESLRRKLGGAARTDVESKFTWDRAVDRILKTVQLPSTRVKQET